MNNYNTSLNNLLQSKSQSAKVIGLVAVFFMFLPTVFQVAGDESLTIWQRLERLSVAAGQTLLTIGAVAVPPESVTGVGKEKPPIE